MGGPTSGNRKPGPRSGAPVKHEIKQVQTTLRINPDLLRQFKILAIANGTSVNQLLVDFVAETVRLNKGGGNGTND